MKGFRKVKYTGKEKTSSLIDKNCSVEWKKGDVKQVMDSKVNNHIKYPYFELASEEAVKEVKKEVIKAPVKIVEKKKEAVKELSAEEKIKLADSKIN